MLRQLGLGDRPLRAASSARNAFTASSLTGADLAWSYRRPPPGDRHLGPGVVLDPADNEVRLKKALT